MIAAETKAKVPALMGFHITVEERDNSSVNGKENEAITWGDSKSAGRFWNVTEYTSWEKAL